MTQELRKLADRAPRFKEWYVLPAREPIDGTHSHSIAMDGYGVLGYWKGHKSAHTDADWLLKKEDAEFIAAANPAAILALLDRVERAEKDAERYRWLRERHDTFDTRWHVRCNKGIVPLHQLDQAITEAMEASK